MNKLEFARIHEMQFHGDIRFHLRLHEMTKEPLWPEPVPPHWHEEYEFLVITRGTGTACLNTRTMHIEPGDILFINAGIVHSFRGNEKNPSDFCVSVAPEHGISADGLEISLETLRDEPAYGRRNR